MKMSNTCRQNLAVDSTPHKENCTEGITLGAQCQEDRMPWRQRGKLIQSLYGVNEKQITEAALNATVAALAQLSVVLIQYPIMCLGSQMDWSKLKA